MEPADLLLSSSEKVTFLGDFHHAVGDHHRRPLFRSLGDLFRVQFGDGEVRRSGVA